MNEPEQPIPARRRSRWIPIELAALGALAAAWLIWPATDRSPVEVRWEAGDSRAPLEPFAAVPPELPLSLTVDLDRPMYVYVASHDVVRGTIAMFPSAQLRSDSGPNPLPAGRHWLPGSLKGQALRWHAGDGVGATSFIVIASEEPLPGLETTLARCRQMGNSAFPGRNTLGTYAPAEGMETIPPLHHPADELLVHGRDLQDPQHDGPMVELPAHAGVFAKVLRVSTTERGPATDEETVRERVQGTLAPLDGALPAPASGR